MFSSHPKADINYLESSDQVQVIGVSLAMDGTALKPELEFDTRQKRIIGYKPTKLTGIMFATTLFLNLKK